MDIRNERGQTLAEYAVVLAIISIVTVSAVAALGGGILGLWRAALAAIG